MCSSCKKIVTASLNYGHTITKSTPIFLFDNIPSNIDLANNKTSYLDFRGSIFAHHWMSYDAILLSNIFFGDFNFVFFALWSQFLGNFFLSGNFVIELHFHSIYSRFWMLEGSGFRKKANKSIFQDSHNYFLSWSDFLIISKMRCFVLNITKSQNKVQSIAWYF